MKIVMFDPDEPLIIVQATVFGRHDSRPLRLAFDTGSTCTSITPDIIDALGCSPRDGIARSSSIGEEPGYMLKVRRFEAFGFGFDGFLIHVHDLPDEDLDGLLGLNFLHRFNYEVRYVEERILIDLA